MNKSEPTLTVPIDTAIRRPHLMLRRAAIASYIDDVAADDSPACFEYAARLKRLIAGGAENGNSH